MIRQYALFVSHPMEVYSQAAAATLPVDPSVFQYLTRAATRLGHRDLASTSKARYAALTE